MKLSKNCINLVKGFEGYHQKLPDGRCRAYRCIVGKDKNGKPIHDGKWTIGYGHTEGVKEGDVWTHEQAISGLKHELTKYEAEVANLVKVDLNQNQWDSIVSFSYNVGNGRDGFGGSTLRKKLNKGDFDAAAREFGKWVNSKGVKRVPGLVSRRAKEAELFLTPIGSTEPAMPQAIDAPAPPIPATIQSSRTIFGVLTAFGASLVGWFKDAVTQIELFEPVKQISSGIGLNLTTVVFAVTIAGLGLALFARLDDAHKGRLVK